MNCPVCNCDLNPLDLQSRNEHITLCLEDGPSRLEFEGGKLVVKRIIPIEKQRKICPICSKSFQQIHSHFKSCALKNDLNPDMMQDIWFKLNDQCGVEKSFPRDLLEGYIQKCTRENRVGAQVEFAKSLLETLPEDTKKKKKSNSSVIVASNDQVTIDDSNSMTSVVSTTENAQGEIQHSMTDVSQVLMQNAATGLAPVAKQSSKQTSKARTPLEWADLATKKANIQLRIDRETSATNRRRYLQAIEEANVEQDVEVISGDCAIILKYTL